nr:TonB-dependent siderophore receptor [Novosphingobium sediminicola]
MKSALFASTALFVSGAHAHADTPTTQGDTIIVTARASQVQIGADDRYQPTPDASTLRSSARALDVPQVVNIVAAQVIRDQRPRYLDDVLTNVSGITQGNTLASTQDTIMKRGFGGNRDGSIMHNGMPLVQGRGFNAAAESVEVLKGPSSLLYGIMDPGGVINIVSKKPQTKAATMLSVSGETYGHGRNGVHEMIDTTGPLGGNLAYRLVVDQEDSAYWRNFGARHETLVAPSLAYYGQKTQVVAWYEYRRYSAPFDRGTVIDSKTGAPLAIDRRERLDEPTNIMAGQTHLGQLSIDHQLGKGWGAHFSGSFNSETYDAGQFRVSGVNTTTGAVTRSNDGTRGALSTDLYSTAYIDGSVQWLGMKHDLQLGAEAEHRRIYRRDLLRQAVTTGFSYFTPIYGRQAISTTVSASDSDQTDNLHNYSFFAQDTVHLGDKWIFVAGGRFLHYRQVAGKGRPFVANTNIEGDKFLPRVGLVYKATDFLSAYLSYTQSLKPASTIAALSTGVVLDSSFAPERGRQFEAGVKVELPHRITGTLAVYDIDKRNVIVSQYNTATGLTDYRTAGRARSRGVELDLAGQITDHLSTIASFAYTDAKTTQDPLYAGNLLANVAKNTASLSGVYDFGRIAGGDRLRLGGGPRYVGRRAGDSANSFFLPSYVVADAFLTYDTRVMGKKASLQLNVKNLFDRTYYQSAVNVYFVSIGDPRRVSLTASIAL